MEELSVGSPDHLVTVVPQRGGMVTHLVVHGREVLYLDDATLEDQSKNVRGGIPILFPICGPLRGDAYSLDGRSYAMKQHGFARNLGWAVVDQGGDHVTLSLTSNDATRAQYPFDFELRFTYRLIPNGLRMEQHVENRGTGDMPFSLGLHPYFISPDNSTLEVHVDADEIAENPYGAPHPAPPRLDLVSGVDVCFTDAPTPEGTLVDHASNRGIHMRASSTYRYVIVWTQPSKPFCCLEPWTSRGDALNANKDLWILPPGRSLAPWVEITVA